MHGTMNIKLRKGSRKTVKGQTGRTASKHDKQTKIVYEGKNAV